VGPIVLFGRAPGAAPGRRDLSHLRSGVARLRRNGRASNSSLLSAVLGHGGRGGGVGRPCARSRPPSPSPESAAVASLMAGPWRRAGSLAAAAAPYPSSPWRRHARHTRLRTLRRDYSHPRRSRRSARGESTAEMASVVTEGACCGSAVPSADPPCAAHATPVAAAAAVSSADPPCAAHATTAIPAAPDSPCATRAAGGTGAAAQGRRWSRGGAPFPAAEALNYPSPPSPPLLFPTLPSALQVAASASSSGGSERHTSPLTPGSPDGGAAAVG